MISCYWFGEGKIFEKDIPLQEVPQRLQRKDGILWVDVESPQESDLQFLAKTFGFHPLVVRSCVQPHRRATIETFESYTFLILRGVDWPEHAKKFTPTQLAVFISQRYIVTCHDRKLPSLREALEKCEKVPGEVSGEGADFILYEILNNMVGRYNHALDRLEQEIERVEEQILAGAEAGRRDMSNISLMRWNVLHMKRIVGPLRDAVNRIAWGDNPHITGKAQILFRNILEQLLRVSETLDTYREVVTDLRDIHLAMVSNRMNEVIKVLTVITTILMPLTVISGIYGMNFKYMPELEWRYGYFAVLGVMLVLTIVTAVLLKRKKWM
jgi:magnesium transporter